MKDIIVWLVHTPTGTIGLVAAVVALTAKQGSPLHRKAGTWFTVSMLIMLVAGFVAAASKESVDDMFLSAAVAYTVFTAWLAAHHGKNETGIMEFAALAWVVVLAITAFTISTGWRTVLAPTAYLFWGGFAVLCAIGDIRNLYLSGLPGVQRVIRHVWRVGFSLLWAVLAFTDKIVKILGSNIKEMPEQQMLLIVAVPAVIILLTIMYWITRILFFSRRRFAAYGNRAS